MKKKFAFLAAVLAAVFVFAAPVGACIDAEGNTVEGVDGAETNCLKEKPTEKEDHFGLDAENLDFGRVTELERSYTRSIGIINKTGGDVIVDVSVEKDGEYALSDWVAFVGGATHFTVSDGETGTVGVRVYVPESAAVGSNYAYIKVADANGYEQKLPIQIDIATDGFKYDSEVTNSWVNPVNLSDKNMAGAKVKNSGNAGFAASYQVKAKSVFGAMDWDILSEEEKVVKPGAEVEFMNESQLGYGIYNVEQRVTFVNAEGRLVESKIARIVINMPIWLLAVIGGVVLVVIVIVIIVKKKRSKK